jgi:glycosyltransferase involved in cell wall biosynthesis
MSREYHIGVDARPLSSALTGIGQYTFQLLKRLPALGHRWTFYSNAPFKVELPEYANVRYVISPRSRIKGMGALWSQMRLPYLIRKDPLDVFWSPRHHLPLLGNAQLPMVLTIHDLVYRLFPKTLKRSNYFLESLLLPASVKRANKIITVSQTSANDLKKILHVPENKIQVIYLGLSTSNVDHAVVNLATLGIHGPYILFLGTLEPRKNVMRLIQAYARLPEALRAKHQLVLAGGAGWGGEGYTDLVRQFNLTERVVFTGYVTEEQRLALLHRATVFAFPSLYEGFGFPVIEAFAAGVPVLTSKDGATAEVAGDAACLINPYDVAEISHGLEMLLTNTTLREKYSQQGLQRVVDFNWDQAAEKTLDVLLGAYTQTT